MAKWKVTLYLSDECQEHATPKECDTPPEWWVDEGNALEDYDGRSEGYCWTSVPRGELDTESDARSWVDVLLKYGDKHQEASFSGRYAEGCLERVET